MLVVVLRFGVSLPQNLQSHMRDFVQHWVLPPPHERGRTSTAPAGSVQPSRPDHRLHSDGVVASQRYVDFRITLHWRRW